MRYLVRLGIDHGGRMPVMADERTTPVNPKWGPLPESLLDKTRKKKPCEDCGKITVGSQADADPRQRLREDGSVRPTARHLCRECGYEAPRRMICERLAEQPDFRVQHDLRHFKPKIR